MNWSNVNILDIFDVKCGATPSTGIQKNWDNGQIKWITPKDLGKINDIFISETQRKISWVGMDSCSTTLVPEDSIIISTRAPIGYIAILKETMCFNQGCKALVPKISQISSKFYVYYLKTKVDYMNSIGRGSTFKEISKSQISNLQIPFPPLNEQKRIVSKIEELFTKLDAAVTELQNVKKQLKRYRQSVLKAAFDGKLTEEWRRKNKLQDWKEYKFIDFCKLQRGYDLPLKKIVKGKFPVVTSSGIKGYHNEYRAKGPCLVTGRSGSVGNVFFYEFEYYWPHNTTLFIKDFLDNYPKFILSKNHVLRAW